jgi:hypothetical protein
MCADGFGGIVLYSGRDVSASAMQHLAGAHPPWCPSGRCVPPSRVREATLPTHPPSKKNWGGHPPDPRLGGARTRTRLLRGSTPKWTGDAWPVRGTQEQKSRGSQERRWGEASSVILSPTSSAIRMPCEGTLSPRATPLQEVARSEFGAAVLFVRRDHVAGDCLEVDFVGAVYEAGGARVAHHAF